MKKFTLILTLGIIFIAISTFAQNEFKEEVRKAMLEIYEDYLSVSDSVLKPFQPQPPFIQRESLEELIIDSTEVQTQYPNMQLFILRPIIEADTLIKGRLYQVYWDKVPRQKIPIFELMLRKPLK